MPQRRRDTIKRRGFFQFNIIGYQVVNFKAPRRQIGRRRKQHAGFGLRHRRQRAGGRISPLARAGPRRNRLTRLRFYRHVANGYRCPFESDKTQICDGRLKDSSGPCDDEAEVPSRIQSSGLAGLSEAGRARRQMRSFPRSAVMTQTKYPLRTPHNGCANPSWNNILWAAPYPSVVDFQ